MWYSLPEAAVGLLLLFFLPGFFTTRALFPEWRLTGLDALVRWVETMALALILSVAYTVLIGSILLNLSEPGFSATWADPLLEGALGLVTLAGAAVAFVRGGFRTLPPAAPPLEPSSGETGGWAMIRQSEEWARRERRLRHALRIAQDRAEAERIRTELNSLAQERDSFRRSREAEYAL
jgi:hypothetical protein